MKRTPFKHLTEHERDRTHALYGHKHNQKDVARVLGVSESAISLEFARYGRKTWLYIAQSGPKRMLTGNEQTASAQV